MISKNAKECKELLEKENYQLIDVRTMQEYKTQRINFSGKNLPLDEMNLWIQNLDKSKKYIISCRSGVRSSIVCKILNENGFTAINLEGGILSWISNKLKTI